MINKQSYQITGMRQDNLVGTGFSSKFAHEIMNLRLNTVGDYTTAAWTTEEGTLLKSVEWINAPSDALALLVDNDTEVNPIIPIGQAIINDQWVVFATQNLTDDNPTRTGYDFIFLYWYNNGSDRLQGTILYAGNLNFDAKHPCETLTFYENEDIQKVYWTDGKNQPRVINIKGVKYHTALDGQFDFVQEVSLQERVDITKQTSGAGLFPPGTVKYAITYYKKYGQETNIVYDSPLYYPIKGERGCSPDELSGDSFEIKVTNIDDTHGFDYIRLYSIVRTSEDATPIVRIVADKEIATLPTIEFDENNPDNGYDPNTSNKYALFVDTNTTGEIVDPTILQYVGGKEIIAQTFDQKNNTFFLGNIELTQKSALEVLKEVKLYPETARFVIGDWFTMARIYDTGGYNKQHADRTSFAYDNEKAIGIRVNTNNSDKSFYQYSNQMTETNHWHSYAGYDANNNLLDGATNVRKHNGNSRKIKIFKYNEYYRFGIQFQDTKGNWSEVIYLTDCKNDIKPVTDEYSSVGVFGILEYTLPNNVVTALLANDYVKARLVCCYPTNADRNILAQGIVNPTMYNNFWKDSHAPDYFSSWFFRPNDGGISSSGDYLHSIQYKQGGSLATSDTGNCEVQSCRYKNDGIFKQYFFTNQNVLTLHSAEIELDESIRTLNLDKVDIRTIGYVPVHSWATSVYVEATAPFPDYFANKGSGLACANGIMSLNVTTYHEGSHFINQGEWKDRNYYAWSKGSLGGTLAYPLYPFHRKGSLANYVKDMDPWTICIPEESNWYDPSSWDEAAEQDYHVSNGAVLQSKVFSNIIFSASTIFTNTTETLSTSHDQTKYDIKLNIFDSNESIPERLDNSLIYYGNLDVIAPTCEDLVRCEVKDKNDRHTMVTTGSYPLYAWDTRTEGTIDDLDEDFYGSDPVPITYNSTPHGVFLTDFGDEQGERNYLNVSGSNISPYLYLVDIYKKVDDETRFGGKANTTNIYLPCGPVVDLRECQNSSPVLIGLEGDHYFMRYDCLKTYPRAIDDVNQIVEILSFMTETRINLDGRYDKNRGLSDNTTITNTNFNLVNKSYTQSDNFFTYTTLDEDISTLNKFGNLITWSKDKISGEDVDTWTNITMVNTADAEGVCGQINKIINVNDTLYSFQDHGIAQIGYNEKTALSTEAGIPLEIANSGKYSGLKYITKEIGCQNKWSISSTKNGAFFIDDSRQELLTLSQELTSLSTINGFDAFLIQQLPDSEHFTPWTPYNPNNFVSYYDRLGNDVYYINKDYCLAWNEQSKTFTSFYSYNDIPLMANIGTHLLMWDNHSPFTFDLNSQEVSEEVTNYTRTTTTTTTEVEHTTTTDTVVIPENIYTNESKRVLTFYHYIAGTERNNVAPALYNSQTNGSIQYSFRDAQDHVKTSWKPATWFRSNTAENIKDSWARMVVQPRNYTNKKNYIWNAHFILSLEFRKNGLPFIIQFDVEGIHYYNANLDERRWQLSPSKPTIKIRTLNVTDEEFEKIKFFLGGWNQPTFNVGNIYHYLSYYRKVLDDVQPWYNVDDSFVTTIDGKERDVACIVKLYDLNMTTIPEQNDPIENYTDNYIIAWEFQGNPFRQQNQYDNSVSVSTDDYTTEEIRYSNVTTTTETIETQTTTWEPTTETVKTTHYTVNNDSSSTRSNIWAARELVDANGRTICSNFFGNYKPYWMTIVCDGITQDKNAFPADKVFNNIEFRADVFDRLTNMPRVNINLPVFDKKAAYNGYQMYKEFPLDGIRKFNTWRVQLPRATYDINGTLTTTRDRIRNPFCYIKLKQTNTNPETTSGSIISDRMILHDLAVYYDMK